MSYAKAEERWFTTMEREWKPDTVAVLKGELIRTPSNAAQVDTALRNA